MGSAEAVKFTKTATKKDELSEARARQCSTELIDCVLMHFSFMTISATCNHSAAYSATYT